MPKAALTLVYCRNCRKSHPPGPHKCVPVTQRIMPKPAPKAVVAAEGQVAKFVAKSKPGKNLALEMAQKCSHAAKNGQDPGLIVAALSRPELEAVCVALLYRSVRLLKSRAKTQARWRRKQKEKVA